jgi:hypothetical protein
VPSLDLRFAESKSLVDAVSGQNLITFTRASTGTFVDSDGVIRSATTNLLLRSEEFDNASWVKTRSSVSANAATAPNGTSSADRLVEDSSASTTHFIDALLTATAGQAYTHSVYAKADGRNWIALQGFNGASNPTAFFDVSTGSVGSTSNGATASIAAVGNGWFRCVMTYTVNSGTATTGTLYLASANNVASYTGDGTSGIFLWGAQLEVGSTVGPYIPTTSTINSAPRFDHNPLTGECLGLLVEEQRVNFCLRSEEFGTSPWAASNVTVTANQEVAPSAATTADTLAATGANGTVRQPITTTAVAMTFSVYLKRKTGTGNVDITADGTTWVTQTISSNAWTRCVVTQTAVAGTSNPGIRLVSSGDEVFAWGAQFE